MSISAVSTNTDPYQAYQANGPNNVNQFRKDFQDLASALQKGDLAGAQTAFAALQQLMPNSTSGNQTSTDQQGTRQNPLAADFSALDQALQSGDLKSAQDAFAKLQQDMQSVQGHHHRHHHHPKASGDTPSLTAPTTTGDNSGSSTGNLNVTV